MQNIIISIISILIYVAFIIYLRKINKEHSETFNKHKKEYDEAFAKFAESLAGKNVSDFKGVQFKGNRPPLRDVTTYD